MAVGAGSLESELSYLAIGRETSLNGGATATSALDFLSASMKVIKERKTLEQIERSRTHSKGISLSKSIEGEVEFYFYSDLTACIYLLEQCFGTDVTSATGTSETAGGAAFAHTFQVGNMDDQSYTSLAINHRKGESSSGKVFEYTGVRVNEITFSAEIDDALKATAGLIMMDETQTSNDVESALTVSAHEPLNFVNGRISVETSFAALTSTSFWHVQAAEWGVANNLKADTASRRIGSDVLGVLPPGMANFPLTLTIRYDTTTAYDAMKAATQLAVELEFQTASTLPGSSLKGGVLFQFPKCFVMDSGDPEVEGPGGQLSSEVTFQVLRDDSSGTGYACQAVVTNLDSAYT